MITKGPFPPAAFAGSGAPPVLEAFFELNQLKLLYRQGWLRRGIPAERCESVADHVFSTAMLAWMVAAEYFPALDSGRVLRLALAHELGEIYAGDLIPADQVAAEEKQRRERTGVVKVTGKLAGGAQLQALWEEYEAGQTAEAVFVKQIDRLEMGLQAVVYESQGFENLDEFIRSAREAIQAQELQELLERAAAQGA